MPQPLIGISAKIIGAERVELDFGVTLPEKAIGRMREGVRALGYRLEALVKTDYLNGKVLHRRSGRLARSINTKFISTATTETASTGTSVFYGRIWEITGSKAHSIFPKKKKALFWPGAAHPVRAVFQPAQAPRPFLSPALAFMKPAIRSTMQAVVTNL